MKRGWWRGGQIDPSPRKNYSWKTQPYSRVNEEISQKIKMVMLMHAIEMRCLKLRVGLHTVMEDTPDQLPKFKMLLMVLLNSYLWEEKSGMYLTMNIFNMFNNNNMILLHISERYLGLPEKPWRRIVQINTARQTWQK